MKDKVPNNNAENIPKKDKLKHMNVGLDEGNESDCNEAN